MDERTEKFHTDAQRPKDKNTHKDIDKLRKFLYKNQNHRFTDKEQMNLYQAIQRYVNAYTADPEPGESVSASTNRCSAMSSTCWLQTCSSRALQSWAPAAVGQLCNRTSSWPAVTIMCITYVDSF